MSNRPGELRRDRSEHEDCAIARWIAVVTMLGVREFALALVACLAVLALPALAQSAAEADALNQQAFQLYQQGKYAEATEFLKLRAERLNWVRKGGDEYSKPMVSVPGPGSASGSD